MAPQSIGIIIDGNRRWAKERGLNPWDGHQEGVRRVADAIRWAKEAGTKHLFFYTFSTENWNRDQREVEYLFLLFEKFFRTHIPKVAAEGVRIRIAGQRERFSQKIQKLYEDAEAESRHHDGLTAWFGLSYGGRAEIVAAAAALAERGTPITEESLKASMWSAELPSPDIIIRTGGEQRLSGFLTWDSVYSELFFSKTPWPGFTKEEFMGILEQFSARQRRMGK